MKNKLLFFFTFYILLFHPGLNFGQTPNLGQATRFAVFTGAGAFTNTGLTTITGDVGDNVGAFAGFPPGIVIGRIDTGSTRTAQAAADVAAAYSFLNTLPHDSLIATPTLGNGQVLTSKIYKIASAGTLNGELILDAQGNPNAKFIFQIDGAFATSMFATISLRNAASLCNVYWAVGGDFTLGDSAVFNGTVIATTIINLLNGSALYGRALSRSGAINLINTTVIGSAPVALTISANGPVIFCPGGSVSLSGNNFGVWSNDSTTASVTVFTSGDYYVTNTNGCGTDTSNHISVTVNPGTQDYGDLDINTWPVASATVPGCQMTGNTPSPYDAVTNPNISVWAGAGMTSEPAPAGGGNTSAGTDTFDDGLGLPGTPLNGGYTYNFTVSVNANLDDTEVFYRLWFDWNGDGNFANDESIQVGSNTMVPATYNGSGTTTTAGTPVTIVVPVKPPFGASPGYKVRLLVNDMPIPDFYRAEGPAYIIDWPNGEVEDYSAPAIILPVTFGKVSAEVKSCNVHLAFETLTELNNKQFEVEYSTNNNSWKVIAGLPGKGNSNALQVYTYIHHQPASAYNYYRIKQIDKNGNYGYSSVMTVRTNCTGAGSIVSYPNPVKDDLSVILPSGLDKAAIKLVNAVGQAVVTNATVNAGVVRINTQLLPKGVYILQVQKDGKTIYNQKFIKE